MKGSFLAGEEHVCHVARPESECECVQAHPSAMIGFLFLSKVRLPAQTL